MAVLQTLLQPFKYVWDKSFTKLVGWSQMIGSAFLLSASQIKDTIEQPTFKSYLAQMDVPKSVIVGLALFGLITWLAHGREND